MTQIENQPRTRKCLEPLNTNVYACKSRVKYTSKFRTQKYIANYFHRAY